MGMLEHSPDVLNGDEAASLFGTSTDQKISGSPFPSPPLPAPAKAKRRFTASARRHVLVRLICSPFAAVFRTTTCARAGSDGDQQATASTGGERGEARRPSLEELLRMEAPSDLELSRDTKPGMDMDPYDSWKKRAAIVVFGFAEDDGMSRRAEDEAPLAVSEEQEQHGAVPGDDEQRTAIVPVEFDFDVVQPAGLGGGGAPAGSLTTVPVNVERLVLVLAALRARSMALMGSYRTLGDRRATDKAEVFYRRPIPLGRRCRVQHLEESPYL